jgi:hypothetical protein
LLRKSTPAAQARRAMAGKPYGFDDRRRRDGVKARYARGKRHDECSAVAACENPIRRRLSFCCARVGSGQTAAIPPSSAMNSRRFMGFPSSRQADGHTQSHQRTKTVSCNEDEGSEFCSVFCNTYLGARPNAKDGPANVRRPGVAQRLLRIAAAENRSDAACVGALRSGKGLEIRRARTGVSIVRHGPEPRLATTDVTVGREAVRDLQPTCAAVSQSGRRPAGRFPKCCR